MSEPVYYVVQIRLARMKEFSDHIDDPIHSSIEKAKRYIATERKFFGDTCFYRIVERTDRVVEEYGLEPKQQ